MGGRSRATGAGQAASAFTACLSLTKVCLRYLAPLFLFFFFLDEVAVLEEICLLPLNLLLCREESRL